MPSADRYTSLTQLRVHADDLYNVIEADLRRRHPFDRPSQRAEIVAHAWLHLVRHCVRHPYPLSWNRLTSVAQAACRKGVRDYRAHEAGLSINAYARYVSLRQVEGVGRGFWPEGTTPAHFAQIFNESGDADEVARRRTQGRTISSEDASDLYRWVTRRASSALDGALLPTPSIDVTSVLDCISAFEYLGRTACPSTSRLALAYAAELRTCLYTGDDPPQLQSFATSVGLAGGTRDRAVAQVRRAARAALRG